MKEIWKEFCEGFEVSNYGRVRSYWNCGNGKLLDKPKKILKPFIMPNGYAQIVINRKGWLVHRLVLLNFIGPCPPDHESCHLNGKRSDNRLSNLQWKTHHENYLDKIKHKTLGNKLTPKDIPKIRNLLKEGYSLSSVGKKFGVTKQVVLGIKKRKIWMHI
jgi:hypothetical protein